MNPLWWLWERAGVPGPDPEPEPEPEPEPSGRLTLAQMIADDLSLMD